MGNEKIITTERELSMMIAFAATEVCRMPLYRGMDDADIMKIAAGISCKVRDHISRKKEISREQWEEFEKVYEAAEKSVKVVSAELERIFGGAWS